MPKGKLWGKLHDDALVKSWVAISGDELIGTNQDSTTFWHRILEGYIKTTKGDATRSIRGLQGRWSIISRNVHMFLSAYDRAEANARSGDGPEDIMNAALATYEIDHPKGQQFANLSSYELLKDNVKFKSVNWSSAAIGRGNASSNEETDDPDSTAGCITGKPVGREKEDRPMGHKRAKKAVADGKFQAKVMDFMETNAEMQKDRKTFLQMLTNAYILSVSADFVDEEEETRAFFRNARRTIFQSQVQQSSPNAGPQSHGSQESLMPDHVPEFAAPVTPRYQRSPLVPSAHFHQRQTGMANEFNQEGHSVPSSFAHMAGGSSVHVNFEQGMHYGANLQSDPFNIGLRL